MTRDIIEVKLPKLDSSKSVGSIAITPTTINTSSGGTLKGATGVKDNSLAIIVNATTAGTITFKAGVYDNAILGNYSEAVTTGLTVLQINNPSRFQKADGDIDVDFTTVAGTIYAVGKKTGLVA